ncbi:MAG: serine hydrolase domain-containing protein, partial [Pseudomonadales bacterium]
MTECAAELPKTAAELGIGQEKSLSEDKRATSQNWTLYPYCRWSFQRVQQFTRTISIPRAVSTSALVHNKQDFSGLEFQDSADNACTINEMLARTYTDGFLVMHRGEVLCEHYFNGLRRDTLHLMMSCSKSFTASLMGIFVEQGVLDPAEQLTAYMPELAGTGFDGATLQQALDMRVGVKFSEDYDDLDADWRKCEVATGWREPSQGYAGPDEMVGYMQTLTERESEHGGVFHYQSILTDVLGVCLQRATGSPFAEMFYKRIWNPIGAEQALVSIIDSSGNAVFEGGFNVCLRDFARFAWLICQKGRHNGQQLIPASWIEECRHPGDGAIAAFAASEYADVLPGGAYHNQWWVRDPEKGVFMALGIHG